MRPWIVIAEAPDFSKVLMSFRKCFSSYEEYPILILTDMGRVVDCVSALIMRPASSGSFNMAEP